ncbi:MAG: glycosyltransferase family protein [Planctomycetota bacterium]|jgi:uncharacterized protein (TIGR00661 family)
MAKIIYAVAGEGFGHSSRSQLIGKRFLDAGHDVIFVGSQKSLVYLKEHFGKRVKEIFGLSFAYQDGRIDKSETLKRNLLKLPEANELNDELFKEVFEPFGPELVISDFEPFSAWWAWRKKVPFISIDHEHMLTLCELEHQRKNWFSRMTAEVVTKCYYVGAASYIIVNFFKTELKIKSAVLAGPIVRPVVVEQEPTNGEHIVMYSTSGKGLEQLKDILQKFGQQKFYVYGFKGTGEFGNCVFKERSTEGFLKDLASSRGVIASAGFSLISECLYLKKRMLLMPIKGQYEQIINAHYIEKLGLGISTDELTESDVRRFLELLDKPMPDNELILWPDNEGFFEVLQGQLDKLPVPIKII